MKRLALIDITTEPPPLMLDGAPVKRHFTFLTVEPGEAKVQFAKFRNWELPKMTCEDPIQIDVEAAAMNVEAAGVAKTEIQVGGWSPFEKLDDETQSVFNKAFDKSVGVRYDPLLVTKQLLNGKAMNFIFLTNANLVYPGSVPYSALVHVSGNATEATVVKIVPHGSPSPHSVGGYMAFKEISDEERTMLEDLLKGFAGSGFDVKYVSTQVVAGINYKFAGTQNMATKDASKYPVLLTVYKPLSDHPVITGVEKVFDLV
jgi:hypothetical protein